MENHSAYFMIGGRRGAAMLFGFARRSSIGKSDGERVNDASTIIPHNSAKRYGSYPSATKF